MYYAWTYKQKICAQALNVCFKAYYKDLDCAVYENSSLRMDIIGL